MPHPVTFKNHFSEQTLFLHRATVMYAFMILCLILLTVRLFYLQVINHHQYAHLSRNNTIRIESIPPSRGLILDRKGTVLADNIAAHRLEVIPEQIPKMDDFLQTVAQLIPLDEKDIKDFKKRMRQQPRFSKVPLKLQLTEEEIATLAFNQYKLKGAYVSMGLIRYYPHGPLLAHVIGYVGRMNDQDNQLVDKSRYRGTHYIGKNGLEQYYEDLLHGHPGFREIETDAYGRSVRVLSTTPPIEGKNLTLTLDYEFQKGINTIFENEHGAVIALEPTTGEVLALVSLPSFEPNDFVTGLDHETYKALMNSPEKPLFNRFLKGQYPPASTIKPFLGLAGLHHQAVTKSTTIYDPGWFRLKNQTRLYRDWKREGHGNTNLKKAIRESCDTYYYNLAMALGIDKMSTWLSNFGFGTPTGIDLPNERTGIVPTRKWKLAAMNQSWYPGETVITGIGQGFLTTTPLQLAQGITLIANRGSMPQIHLLKDSTSIEIKRLNETIKPEHWQEIFDAMEDVTHHSHGTAFSAFQGAHYHMAGKTGTAQVFTLANNDIKAKVEQGDLARHLRDHSLFIGFAPIAQPEIAIAIMAEHTKGAAILARKVTDLYWEQKPS